MKMEKIPNEKTLKIRNPQKVGKITLSGKNPPRSYYLLSKEDENIFQETIDFYFSKVSREKERNYVDSFYYFKKGETFKSIFLEIPGLYIKEDGWVSIEKGYGLMITVGSYGSIKVEPKIDETEDRYSIKTHEIYKVFWKKSINRISTYPANFKELHYFSSMFRNHRGIVSQNNNFTVEILGLIYNLMSTKKYSLFYDILKSAEKEINSKENDAVIHSLNFDLKIKEAFMISNKKELIKKKFFKDEVNFLRKYDIQEILFLKKFYYKNKGFEFDINEIPMALKYFKIVNEKLFKSLGIYILDKSEIFSHVLSQKFSNDFTNVTLIRDYFRMARELKMKPKYNFKGMKSFRKEHERISRLFTALRTQDVKIPKGHIFENNLFEMIGEKGFTLLDSKDKIVDEAETQKHCVASYVGLINKGSSSIYNVYDGNKRFTIELSKKDGLIYLAQLRGLRNSSPTEAFENSIKEKINLINNELKKEVT